MFMLSFLNKKTVIS